MIGERRCVTERPSNHGEREEHVMRRARTIVITALLTLGLVTAVFAGAASAGEELSKKEYLTSTTRWWMSWKRTR